MEFLVESRIDFIAEVGVNHDGSVERAMFLVEWLNALGVSVVKFQLFDSEALATADAPKAPYQEQRDPAQSHQAMLRRLQIDVDGLAVVAKRCSELGMEFLCTPYGPNEVHQLVEIGVRRFKIASADITDLSLLEAVADAGLPVLMSTGMASMKEIERAVKFLVSNSASLTLLHTTSLYPTSPVNVNLRRLQLLRQYFDLPIGFSDHTRGWEASCMAVALGARVIEKHVTYSNAASGPDHAASIQLNDLRQFLDKMRLASAAMGVEDPELTLEEERMKYVSRKGSYAKRDMASGEILSQDSVVFRRPMQGLEPFEIHSYIGRRLSRDLSAGEALNALDFES